MHLIDSMHRGGAESVLIEHVRQAAPDVEIWVCALNRGGLALEEVERLGAHPVVLGKEGGRPAAIRRLAGIMREARIDVVNGHNPYGALYGLIAGRMAGVRAAFRTEHSFHYPGRASAWYGPFVEGPATLMSAGVICVSEAVRQSHASRMPWAAGRFVTVLNGIPDVGPVRPREEVRASLGLRPDQRVAFTAGSLMKQKAQHVMIDGFARVAPELPHAQLLIAGAGPLQQPLEEQIHARGLDGRVVLLGARRDVPDLLNAVDLFVLSSVREGLPMSLLEAMRASLPSVVTRVGGNPEVVIEGEQGHLVAAGDVDAMGAAMRSILGDPARGEVFGRAARERWQAHFTAAEMVKRTEDLYRAALAKRGGGER